LSDGRKKEIYQYIRFFHGALQLMFAITCHSVINRVLFSLHYA